MKLIDLCGVECDEAMMTIRFFIRTHHLSSGSTIEIRSASEPFWTRLSAWAAAFDHQVVRQSVAEGWSATITLN